MCPLPPRSRIWLTAIGAPVGPVTLVTSAVVKVTGSTGLLKVTRMPGIGVLVLIGPRAATCGPETGLTAYLESGSPLASRMVSVRRMAKTPRP